MQQEAPLPKSTAQRSALPGSALRPRAQRPPGAAAASEQQERAPGGAIARRSRFALSVPRRRRRQYVARPVGLQRPYQPRKLHGLEQSRGAVIADLEPPLYVGNRGFAFGGHDAHGLVVERIGFRIARTVAVAAVALLARNSRKWTGRARKDFVDIVRRRRAAQRIDYAVHFLVGYECAMYARRQRRARRQIEHVAMTEQRLGAHLIEDGA